MFQRISQRRIFIVATALFAFSVGAFAHEQEVVGFVGNTAVVGGESFNGQVSTNTSGISVTFTSNPPGLVNYTTNISGTSASVSVPTNPNAPAGNYVIVATPASGGGSKQIAVIAVNDI